jgi:hypothetical protein
MPSPPVRALCVKEAIAMTGDVLAAASSLTGVISNLTTWITGFLVVLATLFLTVGGVLYMTAGGDPGAVEKAKGCLKSAAFGYALAVLAPLLVAALKSIVG